MDEDCIGRREVEKLLGLSRAGGRKLVGAGELGPSRDERGVLWYSREEVVALAERRDVDRQAAQDRRGIGFEFDKFHRQLDSTNRRHEQEALEQARARREEDLIQSHRRIEQALSRMADELRRIRISNSAIESELSQLSWISLAQGVLSGVPDNALQRGWEAVAATSKGASTPAVAPSAKNQPRQESSAWDDAFAKLKAELGKSKPEPRK